MKILLDTHAFIWWDSDFSKLSPLALRLCQDPGNRLILSVASIWEMQIQSRLGKLTLSLPLADIIEAQCHTNNIEILPVHLAHVLALESLPLHHKDPFDHLLIVQANIEEATLLSCDSIFRKYSVNVKW